MKKTKAIKKFIRIIMCAVLGLTVLFAEATTAFAVEYTDYGKYPVSASPIKYSVVWSNPEDYKGFEKKVKYFEIKTVVNKKDMSLYITFPSLGGFRLENVEPEKNPDPASVEKTGVWEPESNQNIKYVENSKGNINMTGSDGTRVTFIEENNSWRLEIWDDESIKLFSITPEQIAFGYQKGELKKVKVELPLDKSEILYGSGERFSGLNLVGKKTTMWNSDAAYHGRTTGTGEDGISALWRGYKNIPIFHSNRGYSLFYNSYSYADIDVGYTNSKKYTLDFADQRLDFYLWTGTVSENLVKYTDLTGKSYLPPKWAFEYQAGGSNGFWGNGTTDANQISVAQRLVDAYAELGTPLNVVYMEGVNSGNTAVYNILKATGARLLTWNNADCISVGAAANYFGDLPSRQLPFARNVKNPAQTVGNWVDYTDPKGIELLEYVKTQNVNWGIVGGMCDFAELVPPNTVFSNGLNGEKMHNFYTYFYGKAYNKALSSLTNNDWFCYIRGAAAGTQKYIGTWSGDQYNTWAGLKMQLSAGLSIGTSGFSIWSTDLGGLDGVPSNDLYNRALMFGLFSPIMRTGGGESKLPTDYNNQVQNTYKQAYWMRESFVNKLYSSAIESNIDGLPMMQAMGLAFPNNPELFGIENQYLFCDDFLVAPVLDGDVYYSKISLPYGTWYNLWTGKGEQGGKTVETDAPYNQIPAYIKNGAVVPLTLNNDLDLGSAMLDTDTVEALLVTPPDKTRTSTYNITEDDFVAYISAPVSSDTFRVQSGKGNKASCLLAYGVPAYSVEVDGAKLERLYTKPITADIKGYYVDSEYKTYIYLGTSDWEKVDIQIGNFISEGNMVKSFEQEKANNILLNNNSFTDVYSISVVDDSMLTAELKENTGISSIVAKWTNSYPSSYNIEISDDGKNWVTVKTIGESLGGIEVTTLDNVSGRYVRLSDVVSQSIAEPALYRFEVYSGKVSVNSDDSIYSDDDILSNGEIDDELEEYEETIIRKRRKKKNTDSEWTILGMPWWMFFVIIGAVVIFSAGLVVVILIRRKHKKVL